jgi:predicted RNA-binding Zn-ribbon protein involved in translation (DUF1610 family)
MERAKGGDACTCGKWRVPRRVEIQIRAEVPPSMVVVEFVCPECGQALGITVVGEGAAQEVN